MDSHYSEKIIDEVRAGVDIVDVVREYVQLKKKGKYFFGMCPFHAETSPSFSVTPSKQIFYCFSCGRGGSVIQFIMQMEGMGFTDALKFLAVKANIKLPEENTEWAGKQQQTRNRLIEINREAGKYFFECLKSRKYSNAFDYIHGRGIDTDIIKKFGIGYAPPNGNLLCERLVQSGFTQDEILKSGLVSENRNKKCVDRFRGRIMFPMFNVMGELIGFGGRVMDSSLPKYINTPETSIYVKGRNLYALNFAKKSGKEALIVVEGYMDVISLHKHGITNVVATMGTALTEHHARLLRRYAEKIVIAFDADAAGQDATMRGLNVLTAMGCSVRVLSLPDGKDPDEFVNKNGAGQFEYLVNNAESLIDYKMGALKNGADERTTEGKVEFLNRTAELLSKVENAVEREMYVKKLSDEYKITQQALYSEVNKKLSKKAKPRFSKNVTLSNKEYERDDEEQGTQISYYERLLLVLLCIDNSVYTQAYGRITQDDFTDQINKEAARIVFDKIGDGMQLAELLEIVGEGNANKFAKIASEDCNFEDNSRAAMDIMYKIEAVKVDMRRREILNILGNNADNIYSEENERLKSELNEILLKRRKR